MPALLRISLLGDFQLLVDGAPGTMISLARLQSLLTFLLLHRDAPQDRSHLAFLLWPDSTEAQAHTNLRKLLYQLRQAFPKIEEFLTTDKQTLQWRTAQDGFTFDVQEFEEASALAAQAAQTGDRAALRSALEEAVRVYQGDLLPACYDEWILPERDRLRQMFVSAAQRLIALLEEERAYEEATVAALQLLRLDPLHEATYRQLMRLYALLGNRAAALRTYHTCAQVLERELGAEPGEMTQALYTSLMRSTAAVAAPAAPQTRQPAEAPLQGRKAEWRQLQDSWHRATGELAGLPAGSPRLVLLTGEAGMGKTRLARELEHWVSRQGMETASARCYDQPAHLAYAPVISWLRTPALQAALERLDATALIEIARLLPEVLVKQPHLAPPTAMTESWQLPFFFAALTRAIQLAPQPLLLLLDDLQWCDQETLQWLHYLLHNAPDARLLLLGTVRVEETSPAHPFMTFLAPLQRDGLVMEIALHPLTPEETAALAGHLLDKQADPSLGETLYRESEGNPLFVVEMARMYLHTHKTGALPAPSLLTRATSQFPPAVQAVLATRLAQLSSRAQTVAHVAAIIGREFTFPVLLQVSGEREEEIVQGLDELWQRRIIREHEGELANAYDFSHEKIRAYIAASLSPAHRRLLHQRVAETLQTIYSADLTAVNALIAAHYERAGLAAQAVSFYQQAGLAASQLYAHTEALYCFEQAARLHQGAWEIAARIDQERGDIYAATGSQEQAREAYQRALARVPADEHIWQARLRWKIAATWIYSFTTSQNPFYLTSIQAFKEAEAILAQVADPANPAWRDEWLALQFARVWRGSTEDVREALASTRPVVEQYGTPEQRKLFAEATGIYNALRHHFVIPPRQLAAWRANITPLPTTENSPQRGMDLALLGIGLLSASLFEEAEEHLRAALSLGEQAGNAWLQRNCLTFLPFALRARGRVEEMRKLLAQAESKGLAENNRVLSGHRAWLAWRDGDLAQAEKHGRLAVDAIQSQQIRPIPFLWTGRWPLIGIALARNDSAAAIDEVRQLFAPDQQPPRPPLAALLEDILRSWDAGDAATARSQFQQAFPLAREMGYL